MKKFAHRHLGAYRVEWGKGSQGERVPLRMLIETDLELSPSAYGYDAEALDSLEHAAMNWAREHGIAAVQFLQVF